MAGSAAGFLGTGSYVPQRRVNNEEIAARVPEAPAEWIVRKTGILERRYAAPHEATSDLAAHAARAALAEAALPADRVDYLIVSTSTGDHPQPPTACLVQNLIGCHDAACFDVNVVCAGFVYAVEIARHLVLAKPGSHALVIGADLYSRILDFDDRSTSVLLGDGAGAVVVGAVPEGRGIMDVRLTSHGEAQELIKVAAGGSRTPASAATVLEGGHYFTMRGRGVRDFVLDNVPPLIDKLLSGAGVGVEDVDCFVPHQANGVLLDVLVDRCGLGAAQTARVVSRYGNLGSASVPVALDDAVRAGRLADGDLVLLAGFGGGMSVGVCLMRWTPAGPGAAL